MAKKARTPKTVEHTKHEDAKRKNNPTAEFQNLVSDEIKRPVPVHIKRPNPDLDPQLVWHGKDASSLDEMVVNAPSLYIQEKIQPKAIIDGLMRLAETNAPDEDQGALFADFNGVPENAQTEFYQHDAKWSNRMILGDSLHVMASLAERENLRGQVQCVYIDPPYGIKFNSNFQWSTQTRDVKDGNAAHITREPEQVKAFRDTWENGVHSYLGYLRDRITAARELLNETGSCFVQIGDENVHRVRAIMDEVFGPENYISLITFTKTSPLGTKLIANRCDYIVWYARDKEIVKYRPLFVSKNVGRGTAYSHIEFPDGSKRRLSSNDSNLPKNIDYFVLGNLLSTGFTKTCYYDFDFEGRTVPQGRYSWKTTKNGMERLIRMGRVYGQGLRPGYVQKFSDFPVQTLDHLWNDTGGAQNRRYVVETTSKVIQRCILMTTDPGDLVLDPTCGSGTTAYVAEQWGRRWIVIDTSRVALALARMRLMGARYPYYLLSDTPEGQQKEADLERRAVSEAPTYGMIRQGFVYERVPHITLKAIANNREIDEIWERHEERLRPLREELSSAAGLAEPLEEWEVPRELPDGWHSASEPLLSRFWRDRAARQKEIDASIAAAAEYEQLFDKPFEDKRKVRVAGPFTVDSLSPVRSVPVDSNGDPRLKEQEAAETKDFAETILEALRASGVQQTDKADRIKFESLEPFGGKFIAAEGVYTEGDEKKTAGVYIGPEYNAVSDIELTMAAKEAAAAMHDVLIACGFSFDPQAAKRLNRGRMRILHARMNADLHMGADLKNTGIGNLFIIFGEPDITVGSEKWIVDSEGKWIAPYDIFALVSGLDRMEEVNGLRREDLHAYARLSRRREIWDDLADAAGVVVDTGEHRGGSGASHNGGISTFAWHCAGVFSGGRDLSDIVGAIGDDRLREFKALVDRLRGDQQNASRADEVSGIPPIDSVHYPLTTAHFHQVRINGVDIFDPRKGEPKSHDIDGIACWFIDTDYNGESFFVRHAYFIGADDPYKQLKTTLKAEINQEAWESLRGNLSRPFPRPSSGMIAVKVINRFGDEAMREFQIE